MAGTPFQGVQLGAVGLSFVIWRWPTGPFGERSLPGNAVLRKRPRSFQSRAFQVKSSTPAADYGDMHTASSLHGLSNSFGPSARMRKAYLIPDVRPLLVAELRVETFTCIQGPGTSVSECSRRSMR